MPASQPASQPCGGSSSDPVTRLSNSGIMYTSDANAPQVRHVEAAIRRRDTLHCPIVPGTKPSQCCRSPANRAGAARRAFFSLPGSRAREGDRGNNRARHADRQIRAMPCLRTLPRRWTWLTPSQPWRLHFRPHGRQQRGAPCRAADIPAAVWHRPPEKTRETTARVLLRSRGRHQNRMRAGRSTGSLLRGGGISIRGSDRGKVVNPERGRLTNQQLGDISANTMSSLAATPLV